MKMSFLEYPDEGIRFVTKTGSEYLTYGIKDGHWYEL